MNQHQSAQIEIEPVEGSTTHVQVTVDRGGVRVRDHAVYPVSIVRAAMLVGSEHGDDIDAFLGRLDLA